MSSSPTPPRTFGFRWTICGLLFFATTINYLDRQVLSILAPKLQGEFGWTEVDYGNIVFAFQLAYALAMIAAGKFPASVMPSANRATPNPSTEPASACAIDARLHVATKIAYPSRVPKTSITRPAAIIASA